MFNHLRPSLAVAVALACVAQPQVLAFEPVPVPTTTRPAFATRQFLYLGEDDVGPTLGEIKKQVLIMEPSSLGTDETFAPEMEREMDLNLSDFAARLEREVMERETAQDVVTPVLDDDDDDETLSTVQMKYEAISKEVDAAIDEAASALEFANDALRVAESKAEPSQAAIPEPASPMEKRQAEARLKEQEKKAEATLKEQERNAEETKKEQARQVEEATERAKAAIDAANGSPLREVTKENDGVVRALLDVEEDLETEEAIRLLQVDEARRIDLAEKAQQLAKDVLREAEGLPEEEEARHIDLAEKAQQLAEEAFREAEEAEEALREAEEAWRLADEALHIAEEDQRLMEETHHREREEDTPLPTGLSSAQGDEQAPEVQATGRPTFRQVKPTEKKSPDFRFQRSLLGARLEMESRAKQKAVDAQADVEVVNDEPVLMDSQTTVVEPAVPKDDGDAQVAPSCKEVDDSVGSRASHVEPPSSAKFFNEGGRVATPAIEVQKGTKEAPSSAALKPPVVTETGEDKLQPVSHWKNVTPSDITSKIVYTLTPEQGIAELKNQKDIDIIKTSAFHLTKATFGGGRAAFFTLSALFKAATSDDVVNAAKTAAMSVSAATRSISDVFDEPANTEKIAASSGSNEAQSMAVATNGDLFRDVAASIGTVVRDVGGIAGSFLGSCSGRTPYSSDAFVAATETTKECVSLLASTLAFGIKQGERAQGYFVKVREDMSTEQAGPSKEMKQNLGDCFVSVEKNSEGPATAEQKTAEDIDVRFGTNLGIADVFEATARSISDAFVDATEASSGSEEEVSTADAASDDLFRDIAASLGTVIWDAGSFISRFGGRTPYSSDAFVAATETTQEEHGSLLDLTLAFGIKQGERAQGYFVKLREDMSAAQAGLSKETKQILGDCFVSVEKNSEEPAAAEQMTAEDVDVRFGASPGSADVYEAVAEKRMTVATGTMVEMQSESLEDESPEATNTVNAPGAVKDKAPSVGKAHDEMFFFAKRGVDY